jgi:hypothetical protein
MARATRHARTPAPPQTSPAPPGAAARPSTPPIRVVPSRESPRSTSRIPPFHLANLPTSASSTPAGVEPPARGVMSRGNRRGVVWSMGDGDVGSPRRRWTPRSTRSEGTGAADGAQLLHLRARHPRLWEAAGQMARATRHARTPAPPQTSPAPPGAAARPSTPPIRVVPSRESPRSTSRIPPFHLANRAAAMPARGVPPQGSNDVVETHLAAAALDTRRVPPRRGPRRWPDPRYRRPTPRPPPGQATSNRAPRRARMRSTTATTSCPGGAPRSPARRGARLPGGPVPSARFVKHKFRARQSVTATVGPATTDFVARRGFLLHVWLDVSTSGRSGGETDRADDAMMREFHVTTPIMIHRLIR